MRRGRAVGLAAAAVVLPAVVVLVPGSPLYLPHFFGSAVEYEGHSIPYWTKALHSPDSAARRQAAHALGGLGAKAGEAVPALAPLLLEDPDREVRIEAALALSKMTPASRAAVPELGRALADKEPFVRMNAALALFRLRGEARPAIPTLIQAVNDEANQTNLGVFTFTIQEIAGQALGRASAGSAEAVPALTAALNGASTEPLRLAVARALGEVGAAARPAVPQLQALLKDNSNQVRDAATEALRKIQGKTTPTGDEGGSGGKPENKKLPSGSRS